MISHDLHQQKARLIHLSGEDTGVQDKKKTQQNFQSSVNKKPQLLIQISKAKNNQYILAVNLFHQKSTTDGVCSSPELQVRDPNSQTRAGAPQRRLRRGKEGKEGRDSLKHC